MTTVQEIEKAVLRLPKPELDNFRSWFETFDQDGWDRELERDVQSGRLDLLADQALLDFQAGRCTQM